MSKERLEEIKQDVKMTRKDLAVSPSNEMTLHMDIMLNSMDYLIEQAERLQELEDRHYRQELIDEHIERLEKQNKRYRETIEHTKLNLKDFRRSANNTFKLIDPRNRVAKEVAFKLQCDIRDCLEALDKKPDDRTVESPHSSWF